MVRVLFVCLGNICRSPLAQGIFEDKIRKAGLQEFFDADSAGTSGWHEGEKPHSGSIRVAKKYGVSIEKQKSRPVSLSDREMFDYVIAMDASNHQNLLSEFAVPREKLFHMREFNSEDMSRNVPDPWGHGEDAFENVFRILDQSMDHFLKFLSEQHPDIFRR